MIVTNQHWYHTTTITTTYTTTNTDNNQEQSFSPAIKAVVNIGLSLFWTACFNTANNSSSKNCNFRSSISLFNDSSLPTPYSVPGYIYR